MEKEAFYFPHFCNARHDRKIRRMRKELGMEGYGIYFMLLEILREQQDLRYPMEDLDLLAEEFGVSEAKIKVSICNYQLFEVDEDQKFFSPKLLIYLEPYFKMKDQRRAAGIKSGAVRKSRIEGTTVERVLNENEQRKGKESKVKEMKEKEIVVVPTPILEEPQLFSIENCHTIALLDERWTRANSANADELFTFNSYLERQGKYSMIPIDYKKYFSTIKGKYPDLLKISKSSIPNTEWEKMCADFDCQLNIKK